MRGALHGNNGQCIAIRIAVVTQQLIGCEGLGRIFCGGQRAVVDCLGGIGIDVRPTTTIDQFGRNVAATGTVLVGQRRKGFGDAQDLDKTMAIFPAAAFEAGRRFFEEFIEAAAFGNRARNGCGLGDPVEQRRIVALGQVDAQDALVQGDGLFLANQEILAAFESQFDAAAGAGNDDVAFHDRIADFQCPLAAILATNECLTFKNRDLADCVCHDEDSGRNTNGRSLGRRQAPAYWTEVQVGELSGNGGRARPGRAACGRARPASRRWHRYGP